MFKTVLLVILVILAVAGLCELIHALSLLPLGSGRKGSRISVIMLKSGSSAAQLRFALNQLNWLGSDFAEHIVAVSSDISGEELELCRIIARNRPVTLCPESVLPSVISSILS